MMIKLSSKQLGELIPLSGENSGYFGKCYKYNDGVLKVFFTDVSNQVLDNINNNLKRQSPIIMYPKSKLYIEDKFKGYYANMAPGISLENLVLEIKNKTMDLSFDDYLSIYYDKFLPCLIKENVIFDDIKLEHTFIKDNFYFIDTDLYKKQEENVGLKSTKDINLSNLNFFVFNYFIYSFSMENFYVPDNFKEDYMERLINNIRYKTNYYVDSFKMLDSYKF